MCSAAGLIKAKAPGRHRYPTLRHGNVVDIVYLVDTKKAGNTVVGGISYRFNDLALQK